MDWTQIHWRAGIGDPTFMGWVTVAAYLLCAGLSLAIYARADSLFYQHLTRQRTFWCLLAVVMFLLAVNKQLDIQSLFTDIGRIFAKQQGWYNNRRSVQKLFILAVLFAAVATAFALTFAFRHILKTNIVALLGVCFVLAFVVIRAASFHHMDRLIGTEFLGIRTNWVLELFGLVLITINATSLLGRKYPQAP